jgi:hypothetical protein
LNRKVAAKFIGTFMMPALNVTPAWQFENTNVTGKAGSDWGIKGAIMALGG